MNRTFSRYTRGRRSEVLFRVTVCVLLAGLGWCRPLLAAADGVDAVLLMDSSGSMAKNDPGKLRVPAAKMFMSLLDAQDRIGLISFSDNGYPVLHLTAPSGENKADILGSADKVSSRGVYTNLYAALARGVAMLDKESQPERDRMLVLMSDGKMDVGDTDDDWALTQKLQGELLQSVKDKGIKVYTIAFTEASDVELLREIASETGALFKLARSDRDLHEVFSAIFESAKAPDMLPIEGGQFVVDGSIEEVTIVASKEREDVRIFLQAPDGRKLSSDDAGDALKWFLSQHFDMITLQKPQTGPWKLLFSSGNNRAYIVTNMSLNHNPQQPNLKTNEDMVLETWLEQDGKLLDREAILTNTRFYMDIRDPAGNSVHVDLLDQGDAGDRRSADGVYSNTLSYANPGAYRIQLVAQGETFQRQKTVHLEVAAAPAGDNAPQLDPQPEPEPVTEPESAAPVEPQAAAETAPEVPQAPAQTVTEEQAPPEPAAPERKKGLSLGLALGVFAAINVLLGGIAGGVWWFMKKRRKPVAADAASEAQEA
jgi:hypothetical protein